MCTSCRRSRARPNLPRRLTKSHSSAIETRLKRCASATMAHWSPATARTGRCVSGMLIAVCRVRTAPTSLCLGSIGWCFHPAAVGSPFLTRSAYRLSTRKTERRLCSSNWASRTPIWRSPTTICCTLRRPLDRFRSCYPTVRIVGIYGRYGAASIPLQRVAVSPQARHVVIVNTDNVASVLDVAGSQIGSRQLQLPQQVQALVFSPNESRLLLRTARWVHRAAVTQSGLSWIDAVRIPKIVPGSDVVLDSGTAGSDPLGGRLAMLTRDSGFAEVAEIEFAPSDGPAVIGSRPQLLDEWRHRLVSDDGS